MAAVLRERDYKSEKHTVVMVSNRAQMGIKSEVSQSVQKQF